MTLNDKYCDLIDNDNGCDNQLHADRCEQIADEFAIGFAEWLLKFDNLKNEKEYVIKQLLEMFKKEKGL
jgi:hypothetical protein